MKSNARTRPTLIFLRNAKEWIVVRLAVLGLGVKEKTILIFFEIFFSRVLSLSFKFPVRKFSTAKPSGGFFQTAARVAGGQTGMDGLGVRVGCEGECLLTNQEAFYRRGLMALLAAWLLVTGWNLSGQAVSNPDEARYACPARTMIRFGDANGPAGWLVPHFNGEPRIKKPPLFYWVLAVFGHLGTFLGVSLTAAFRLVSVLAGLGALAALLGVARRLFSPRTALFAGGIFTATWLVHELARQLTVDMLMTGCLLVAWYAFVVALERLAPDAAAKPRRAWPALALFYAAAGAACLTKGPVLTGSLVILPMFAYVFWTGRFHVLKRAGLWWGVPLSLFIGFSWYFPLKAALGDNAGWSELYRQSFGRAVGKVDHIQPLWFYLSDLPQRFIPWIAFLLIAAWQSLAGFGRLPGKPQAGLAPIFSLQSKFLLCALGLPFALFCLSLSKRGLYLLPLYPFASLWIAWTWECLDSNVAQNRFAAWLWKWLLRLLIVATPLAAATLAWPDLPVADSASTAETILAVFCVVLIALCAVFAWRQVGLSPAGGQAAGWLFAALFAALFSYEATLRPRIERAADLEGFYREIARFAGDRPLVMLGESSNEAVWHLDKPTDDVRRPELRKRLFDTPGALLLTTDKVLNDPQRPELKNAVRVLQTIKRKERVFHLAEPDPQNTPANNIFEQVKTKPTSLRSHYAWMIAFGCFISGCFFYFSRATGATRRDLSD
jgi:4-amino-4-deoxy-L-arabinose transferase-like glycosyltransferase